MIVSQHRQPVGVAERIEKRMRTVKAAEERRKEILDVAEQMFAEKGFDHASTNDIIGRIGIARGTLYHHFDSKEAILDALVERLTREAIQRARLIVANQSIPLLERLSRTVLALNIHSQAAPELFRQIHRPQNALLHQKMQELLLGGVVPLIASLIEEGNETGLFAAKYPAEAAEMIMMYSSLAFDELAGFSPDQAERKIRAFIHHIERMLEAKEGCLETTIRKMFRS